ncbi:MAG: SDR family NAD(P)-dependent oxidoreductase [Verrucomicrobia bacterium]|jgi:3-oxoacyl-[acyl-carrier protein] reductase|nr:SDR family NAD(P)-dependent oxidoreductase [Verrucomicrobiota bacterium]
MEIEGVKSLITGAANGLGKCFALELLKSGAEVVAGDIDEDGLEDLVAEASELPGKLHTYFLDVVREDLVKELVHAASEKMGHINVLINNAGVLRDGLLITEEESWIRKLPTAQWKTVLDINLTGPFLLAREVAAKMVDAKTRPGVIINISSVTRSGNPGQSNYAASKAGLDALTRTWALELAPCGIRVGGIAPGVVDTPILGAMDEEHQQALFAKVPIGRIGAPYEIWLAAKFIIECEYFTGRTIDVDGGANF